MDALITCTELGFKIFLYANIYQILSTFYCYYPHSGIQQNVFFNPRATLIFKSKSGMHSNLSIVFKNNLPNADNLQVLKFQLVENMMKNCAYFRELW